MMAPIHALRLLEIYCSTAKESCPHLMRTTGSCTPIAELKEAGLIEEDPRSPPPDSETHGYAVTEKGRFYIEALLAMPLPVKRWEIPKRGR